MIPFSDKEPNFELPLTYEALLLVTETNLSPLDRGLLLSCIGGDPCPELPSPFLLSPYSPCLFISPP